MSLANRGKNITTGKALLTFALELIKQHRPQRVLFHYFWAAHIVKSMKPLPDDFRDESFEQALE